MKFCPKCGNQISDNTVFCPACGAKTGDPPPPEINQPASGGTYTQETGGSYYSGTQSGPGGTYQAGNTSGGQGGYYQAGSTQGGSGEYHQAGSQSYQSEPQNYQTGPQSYQSGPQNYQTGPQNYQARPQNYQGGPNRPGGPGNNKLLIIIIAVVVGLCLIGGGIFVYSKLAGKNNNTSLSNNNNNNSSIQADDDDEDDADVTDEDDEDSAEPSQTPSAEPSDDYDINDDYHFGDNGTTTSIAPSDDYSDDYDYGDGDDYIYSNLDDFLMIFNAAAADDIVYALEDTGMDTANAQDFYYYGEWINGSVYSFTYEDSVVDLLLNFDDTVFSIETMGVQIYLNGYGSYWLDDYLGSTYHYDENWPDDGYVFYLADTNITSWIGVDTSYDYDYIVQLLDAYDGSLIMAFFIYGGHSDFDWYMAVPPGDYTIEYALGTTWYDVNEIFGPDTEYYRADGVYSFYEGEQVDITLDVYGGTGIPSTNITSEYAY